MATPLTLRTSHQVNSLHLREMNSLIRMGTSSQSLKEMSFQSLMETSFQIPTGWKTMV